MSERIPEHIKRILENSNRKIEEIREKGPDLDSDGNGTEVGIDVATIQAFQEGLLVPFQGALASFRLPSSCESVYFGIDQTGDQAITDRMAEKEK